MKQIIGKLEDLFPKLKITSHILDKFSIQPL